MAYHRREQALEALGNYTFSTLFSIGVMLLSSHVFCSPLLELLQEISMVILSILGSPFTLRGDLTTQAYLGFESFDDGQDVLRWDTLDGLLDDVVAILIYNMLQNVVLECLQRLSLLVGQRMFESLPKLDLIMNMNLAVPTFCTT